MRSALAPRALALVLLAVPVLVAARPAGHAPATPQEQWAAWQQHEQMAKDSLFSGLKWRDIGPTVQGGRVVEIASTPDRPYTFYVAYATGGVWKTTNNGVSFEPLSDRLPTMVTGAIAVDPQHADTVWVGSGESNSSRSSYGGLGVFRTDDGGKTFKPMGLDDTDRISRILVDPKDSNTVYVAALGKLYTEGGRRGVFRTRDGGKTWSQVLKGDGPWTGTIDLVMDPRDAKVLYAATWQRERKPWKFVESGKGSSIWKSTDGGDTWNKAVAGFPQSEKTGRIGLSIAASHPDTLYASVDNWDPLPADQADLGERPLTLKRIKRMSQEEFLQQDPEEIETFIRESDLDTALTAAKLTGMMKSGEYSLAELVKKLEAANDGFVDNDIHGLEIYRSDDAGKSWHRTNAQVLREVTYTYGYYFGQVRVSPTDPEHVYAQGLPMIESVDGGKTWKGLNDPKVHVDYHELLIDPNYPQRVIAGNDGGLDMSYDGGKTWLKLDAQPVGQFYDITYDMADPYTVCGGLQDNGSYRGSSRSKWQQGEEWNAVGGGDGMWCQIDPRDNATVYTGSQFGAYSRSGPAGKHEVRARAALKEPSLHYNWNSPLLLSPHNADVVYLGANRLFRSMDKGETWQAISPALATTKNHGNVPFGTITTVAESPRQFGLLWVGTDDGNVWMSDSAGAHWNRVDEGLPADRWVSRVEASHFDEHRVYVSLNGYRNDDATPYLYRSDDQGRHWTAISKGLPAEAINVVREDPVNVDLLYVGTDRGVYVSLDRGATWSSLQANLPNVPVHDLAVHPRERELIAGTHGRSAWVVDVLPLQESTGKTQAEALKLFPVEDVQAERDWRSRPSLWFDEAPYLPKLTGAIWAKAAGKARITVQDSDKQPLRQIDVDLVRGMNTWEWDLQLDQELALRAEREAQTKAREKEAKDKDKDEDAAKKDKDAKSGKDGVLAKTPYAEAVRLGHRLYAIPGKYTLHLAQGDAGSDTPLEVKAAEARKPRAKPEPKLRGKDKWARPEAAPEPGPRAEEEEEESAGK